VYERAEATRRKKKEQEIAAGKADKVLDKGGEGSDSDSDTDDSGA
jgi:hypothetical protein